MRGARGNHGDGRGVRGGETCLDGDRHKADRDGARAKQSDRAHRGQQVLPEELLELARSLGAAVDGRGPLKR